MLFFRIPPQENVKNPPLTLVINDYLLITYRCVYITILMYHNIFIYFTK